MVQKSRIPYSDGTWLNPPTEYTSSENSLLVTTSNSDFWQKTFYGFERDSGHALLLPFANESAIEVSFINNFNQLYDQAGIFIRVSDKE